MAPPSGDDWIALVDIELPVAAVAAWARRPDCGAQVLFTGTVRNHSDGRPGVTALDYDAYRQAAVARLGALADAMRCRYPTLGRVALLHRVGHLPVGDEAVVVAVCTPQRADAFDAARFGIDTLKATVPIWKRETWAGGEDWGSATPQEVRRDAPSEARP